MNKEKDKATNIPLLSLRDIIVFPHSVVPLFVGRTKSINAIEAAFEGNKELLLAAQKDPKCNEPDPDDVYVVGTISKILQMMRLPDGTIKILVEGIKRARIVNYVPNNKYFLCEFEQIEDDDEITVETEALMRIVISTFDTYVKLNRKIPPETLTCVAGIIEPSRLADTISMHLSKMEIADKQKLLEIENPNKRLEELFTYMQLEIEVLMAERKIKKRVKKQMEKNQKEKYLIEQLKAIRKELGEEHKKVLLDETAFDRLTDMIKQVRARVEELEEKSPAKDVLTMDQAAVFLQISEDKMNLLLKEEGFPAKIILDEWRISRTALMNWLEKNDNSSEDLD